MPDSSGMSNVDEGEIDVAALERGEITARPLSVAVMPAVGGCATRAPASNERNPWIRCSSSATSMLIVLWHLLPCENGRQSANGATDAVARLVSTAFR